MRTVKCFQTRRRQPGRSALSVIFWWVLVSNFTLLLLKVFYRIRLIGKEHIPETGPAIFIANHQSFLDPCIVGVLTMDRPFSSLARASLFRNPFFAWVIRQLGAVPIKQGRGDAGALRTALGELEAGRTVLLYPEGSRTPDGRVHEFQRGVLLLIKKAKAPIIPIALEGAHDVWPIGRSMPRLTGRLAVKADEPIDPETLMREHGDAPMEFLRSRIDQMRAKLRDELRQRTGGKYPRPDESDQEPNQNKPVESEPEKPKSERQDDRNAGMNGQSGQRTRAE
ncbi:MAG: 1-acyl-sn-glycerol-3-phosphate acyltransferase [Phycisphaerales bacterium]|nr:MAG: 1-acyl-sn-glycerol-3-phosphate acyltransferase [Phycisphaerales bacterium]